MTGTGHSPIAASPIDSFRGRKRSFESLINLHTTKKNLLVVVKNKTVRNRVYKCAVS
jgi:hypothetical protein